MDPLYADEEDFKCVHAHLNDEEESAFIVSEGLRRWRAGNLGPPPTMQLVCRLRVVQLCVSSSKRAPQIQIAERLSTLIFADRISVNEPGLAFPIAGFAFRSHRWRRRFRWSGVSRSKRTKC